MWKWKRHAARHGAGTRRAVVNLQKEDEGRTKGEAWREYFEEGAQFICVNKK